MLVGVQHAAGITERGTAIATLSASAISPMQTEWRSIRSGVLRLVLSAVSATSFPPAAEICLRRPDSPIVQRVDPVRWESRLERNRRRGRCESLGLRLARRPCAAVGPCEHRQGSFLGRIYSATRL